MEVIKSASKQGGFASPFTVAYPKMAVSSMRLHCAFRLNSILCKYSKQLLVCRA